jgi:ribosomal protein S18 acetylase RimI-like enzyme
MPRICSVRAGHSPDLTNRPAGLRRTTLGAVTRVLLGNERHVDGAAQVWAEATAARDGADRIAPLELSRPVIAGVLSQPGAVLVVAVDDVDGDRVIGFAVAEPVPAASGPAVPASGPAVAASGPATPATAEVRYVGVTPRHWGSGLGGTLLRRLCAELAATGYGSAQLLVYTDNAPATRLYRRLGWRPAGSPRPHPRTGKPEQRYRLSLSGARPGTSGAAG